MRGPSRADQQPLFLWVHYFDPHTPYAPPEPYPRRDTRTQPYLGEVAAMDEQIGAPRRRRSSGRPRRAGRDRHRRRSRRGPRRSRRGAARPPALPVDDARAAGGGGTGRRGERRATRRSARAGSSTPCSTGRASAGATQPARGQTARRREEVVLGEAMKPFLEYGWQPQVMAVDGRQGDSRGKPEVYDSSPIRGDEGSRAGATLSAGAARRRWRTIRCRRRKPRARRESARRRGAAAAREPRLRQRDARRRSCARTRRVRPT